MIRALFGLVGLLIVAGCGAPAEPDNPRIALVMKSLANEFFATMAEGAQAHQAANAERYDLVVNGIKDERDLTRQVALVEEMIAAGVDAIVIAPADSKALVPVLDRALQAGVVVVNIDNKLDEEVLTERGLSIPFVGPDNRQGARKVGDYLGQRLEVDDGVLILEGTRTSFNAQQRLLGFQDAMTEVGVEVLDSQTANWEMAPANTLASAMLSAHPEAKAILAANDNMALGALAAVRALNRDHGENQVLVVGFDNISAVQAAIKEGKILASADQYADQLAAFGIDFALSQLDSPGAKAEDRQTPVDLVTAETL